MADTRDLIIASVGAGLLIAAGQGLLGGVAYWLLGLKEPVVWGVATAFCSLIPVVGSALVWAPVTLWLLLSGDVVRGVILLIVGVVGVGMVDNVLRPMHPRRPHISERPCRIPRHPRWGVGVWLHWPGARADHPGDGRQPDHGVHAARAANRSF